jgi:phosphoenolpyruvate-protein kinase (PTS system EI component)
MNALNVPEVKAAIRKLSAEACRNFAEKSLDQDNGDRVRQLLADAKNGLV